MDTTTAFETEAMLLRAVPVTTFGVNGRLRLHDGRLQFAKSNDTVLLDEPVSSLRDAGTMGKYVLTLTIGAKRRRLVIGDRQRVIHAEGVNPLLKAAVLGAQIDRARKNDAVNRDLVGQWLAILQPLISTAS